MDQAQQSMPGGPPPTVPAASDIEAFAKWRVDMQAYTSGLYDRARSLEETATHSRARAAECRQHATELTDMLAKTALPQRVPGTALHEQLAGASVFES